MQASIEAANGQLDLFRCHENLLHLMTVSEIGHQINLRKTALRQEVQAGRIPYMLIDEIIRFEPKAIASWFKSQVVDSQTCNLQEERKAA